MDDTPPEQIVTRRPAERHSVRRRTAVSSLAAGALLLAVSGAGFYTVASDRDAVVGQEEVAQATVAPLEQGIRTAQERLKQLPGDYGTWAQLGSAYVEEARVTADPTYYQKAEGALQQSLALRPEGNDAALTGQGTAPGTLEGEQPPPAKLAADELREETGLRAESMVVLGQR